MKTMLAVLIGLAVGVSADAAGAYVVQVVTSIPAEAVEDPGQFDAALKSALEDVLDRAIGFVPTVVTLQHAKVVGARLYMLLLIADDEGEVTMERLKDGS